MSTCGECKWFRKDQTDGMMHRHLMMLNGRSPSTQDVIAYGLYNKDGMCNFNPKPVQKLVTDGCGQFTVK